MMVESLLGTVLVVAAANTVVTVTVSKGLPFRKVRDWAWDNEWETLHETLECPYCLAHWTAFLWLPVAPITGEFPVIFTLFVWWLVVIFGTALLSGVLFLLPPLNQFFPRQHKHQHQHYEGDREHE